MRRRSTVARTAVIAALVATTVLCAVMPVAAQGSESDWVSEINRYRTATGLAPVSDQPAWDVGMEHHFLYLRNTPGNLEQSPYNSVHTENPASPWYTPDGANEAASSDIILNGQHLTEVSVVDAFLTGPFHAIGIFDPQLTQVALQLETSEFGEMELGNAMLDIGSGIVSGPQWTVPILFPGPGMTTDLVRLHPEAPDPDESCKDDNLGLPIFALLTQAPDPALTATVTGPTGTVTSTDGTLCVIDSSTYVSTDPVFGSTGAATLAFSNAVVLIPRDPLTNGTYAVTIHQPGQPDVAWSFAARVPPPVSWTKPTIIGDTSDETRVGDHLLVDQGTWDGYPTAYSFRWYACDTRGANCESIANTTDNGYTIAPADLGSQIRVTVTARNTGGSTTSPMSAPTSRVLPSLHGAVQLKKLHPRLRLTPGKAVIRLPRWTGRAPLVVTIRAQRRVCHRARSCQWRTISLRRRTPHTRRGVATLPTPRPTVAVRVSVTARVSPFNYLYVRYWSDPITATLGPLRK